MAELKIGSALRDRDKREYPHRVVNVYALDSRYAYVVDERPPHRKSRILRSRLCSSAFEPCGAIVEFDLAPDFFKRAQADA